MKIPLTSPNKSPSFSLSAKFSFLLQDTFAFLLTAGDIMDNYFPERVKRICIVNAPFWFAGAWKGVSRLLPATITDKVQISGVGQTMTQLLRFIALEELPLEYVEGSKSSGANLALGQHPQELRLSGMIRKTLDQKEKFAAALTNTTSAAATSDAQSPSPPSVPSSPRRPPPLSLSPQTSLPGSFKETQTRPLPALSRTQSQQEPGLEASSAGSLAASSSVRRAISSPDLSSNENETKNSWNPFSRLFRPPSKHAHLGDDHKWVYARMTGMRHS
jgi:hypothetical protein